MPPKRPRKENGPPKESKTRSKRLRSKTDKGGGSDPDDSDPESDTPEDRADWLERERQKHCQAMKQAAKDASIDDFDRNYRIYTDMRTSEKRPADHESRKRKACKAVGNAANFEAPARKKKHIARTAFTALYEDFMYFQVPDRRNQYEKHIDHDPKNRAKNPFRKDMEAGRLWSYPVDGSGQNKQLRDIAVEFESRFVGTLEEASEEGIGPRELHTRVPVPRRRHVGLGAECRDENPVPRLPLDEDAIEDARADFETMQEDRAAQRRKGQTAEDEEEDILESHTDRRAREIQQLGTDLPSKLYVHEDIPTAQNLDRTRLATGLFISAGETSRDWNTSYDQLGIVQPGHIAVEKHLIFPKVLHPEHSDAQSADDLQQDGQGRLFEFWRERQPHKAYKPVPTTEFAETSYGRLEREHINMDLAPSSPVESPPRSPIQNKKTDEGWRRVPIDVAWENGAHRMYRSKFIDQFGVGFRSWSEFKGLPRAEGFRVPYDPIDIPALPASLQARYQTNPDVPIDPSLPADPDLLDDKGCFKLPAPEGTSMRLLRIAKEQPYQSPIRPAKNKQGPWPDGTSDDDDDDDPDEDDGDSSDDDGDLFRKAYLEASGVVQGGVGGAGSGGSGGDGDDDDDGNEGHVNQDGSANNSHMIASSESTLSDPSDSDGNWSNGGPGNNGGKKGAAHVPIPSPSTESALLDLPDDVDDCLKSRDNDGNNGGSGGLGKRKRKGATAVKPLEISSDSTEKEDDEDDDMNPGALYRVNVYGEFEENSVDGDSSQVSEVDDVD